MAARRDGITVSIDGLQEALKGLDGWNKAVRYRVTRDAVNAGAGVLRDGARRNVATETKLLKNNLVVKTFVPRDDSGIYCKVGARRKVKKAVRVTPKGITRTLGKKGLATAMEGGAKLRYRSPTRYAHLVEFGTKRHEVRVKNAAILSDGVRAFGQSVMVSAKPKPFMSFTVRSLGATATSRAARKIKQGIEYEARKVAVKAVVRAVRRSDR